MTKARRGERHGAQQLPRVETVADRRPRFEAARQPERLDTAGRCEHDGRTRLALPELLVVKQRAQRREHSVAIGVVDLDGGELSRHLVDALAQLELRVAPVRGNR
ncbi:hypothetical protein QE367_003128 [Microbacterium paludicola]|uniref:Uncharacterized protein n=1 Tax=Microbacterium paludicola TaxID=300019 RepID=A0ABU1I4W4_9MICO|nr:hypothetical protein [Microbacterium paludicola]MDR6168924.1 hypothetical protein [Microbacterium paludicola]